MNLAKIIAKSVREHPEDWARGDSDKRHVDRLVHKSGDYHFEIFIDTIWVQGETATDFWWRLRRAWWFWLKWEDAQTHDEREAEARKVLLQARDTLLPEDPDKNLPQSIDASVIDVSTLPKAIDK